MTHRKRALGLLAWLPLAAAAGCHGAAGASATRLTSISREPPPVVIVPVPAESVARILRTQRSGFHDAARLVVRDSAMWRAVWTRLGVSQYRGEPAVDPPGELPRIDFTREMVVLVALGFRGCGDNTISIDSVYREAHRAGLYVVVRSDGENHGCLGSLVTPLDAVRVPSTAQPVRFVERRAPPPTPP